MQRLFSRLSVRKKNEPSLNSLPDDLLEKIAKDLGDKNASMLKMTSKKMHEIVSGVNPNLPLHAPSYESGTGKYQSQYDDLKRMYDMFTTGDIVVDDDKKFVKMTNVFFLLSWTLGFGLQGLLCNKDIKGIRPLYKKIISKLRTWKSPRYKKALKVIKKNFGDITEDDEMHGAAILDAVIMVSIEDLRCLGVTRM